METQSYRGVKNALTVTVLEGDGQEIPYQEIEYVIERAMDGSYYTVGKIVPLSQTERDFFSPKVENSIKEK